MTYKLKTLGATIVAMLALTAVVDSAAAALSYRASSYPTTATAESAIGNDKIATEGGTVECKAHFQGTMFEARTQLTVTPTYSGCKAFGFISATVNLNGCDYLFNEPFGSSSNYTARVDVACPWGKTIEITASTCKIAIGSQFMGGSFAVTNTMTNDVGLKAGLFGIEYTVLADGFGCPFAGTGPKYGATYNQSNSVTFDTTNGAWIFVN